MSKRIQSEENLDFQGAVRLSESLPAHRGLSVDFDCSEVRHLSAACLQVLLSALKTWASDNEQFVVSNPSDAFLEGLALLGIDFEDTFLGVKPCQ